MRAVSAAALERGGLSCRRQVAALLCSSPVIEPLIREVISGADAPVALKCDAVAALAPLVRLLGAIKGEHRCCGWVSSMQQAHAWPLVFNL